jgi:hypothetical protein
MRQREEGEKKEMDKLLKEKIMEKYSWGKLCTKLFLDFHGS